MSTVGISKGPDGTIVITGGREAVAQWWINEMRGHMIAVRTGEQRTVVSLSDFSGGCDNLGAYWNCAEYGSTHVRSWHEVHEDLGNVMIDTSARCD